MSIGAQPAISGGGGVSTAAARFQSATQMGSQSSSNLQALLQSAAQVCLCMICMHMPCVCMHMHTLTPPRTRTSELPHALITRARIHTHPHPHPARAQMNCRMHIAHACTRIHTTPPTRGLSLHTCTTLTLPTHAHK